MGTIDDVARMAGVSKSTVSRAFSRPESVKEATRARIMRAAEQESYHPNRSAQLLAGAQRTGCIGLFVPDIGSPMVPALIKSVQYHARQRDVSVFVADSDEHLEDEFSIVRAMARQVDGVILGSPRMTDDQVHSLGGIVPVVTVNRSVPGIPAVIYGDEGVRQAVEHLFVLGHRRIGYLAGPSASFAHQQRRTAILAAADVFDVEITEFGPFRPWLEEGIRAADIVAAADVSAVIAFNDLIALGVCVAFQRRGTPIDGMLSIIGVDDSWLTEISTPTLTSVRNPVAAAGATAVRRVLQAIDRTPVETSTIVLPTRLIVRGSTGPCRDRLSVPSGSGGTTRIGGPPPRS